jgi:hypothetical protein
MVTKGRWISGATVIAPAVSAVVGGGCWVQAASMLSKAVTGRTVER